MRGLQFVRMWAASCGAMNGATTMTEKLKKYRQKRDFRKTTEPAGETTAAEEQDRAASGHAIFVLQKHDASRLHYDFRLEIDGVLKSWAVPKGPSLDPAMKRLAALTEDHPLEYAIFEGVIPEGEYGAGPVIVWDGGRYTVPEKHGKPMSMTEGFKNGHIEVILAGRKLRGGFALIRTAGQGRNWLLIKMKDREARPGGDIVNEQPQSILSGRTINDKILYESVYDSKAEKPKSERPKTRAPKRAKASATDD
jgi:bifunctional non-homologous end joining protein LigD